MEKLLQRTVDIGRSLTPAAQDLARSAGSMIGKLAGGFGKLVFSAAKIGVKKLGERRLVRKGRRFLRRTALISGSITVLSCVGLVLLRRR